MSEERELLKRFLTVINIRLNGTACASLIKDAKELLAQPEQKPVAWFSLSDIEWMNIVNNKKILELTNGRHNSEEAVNLAVKMTEEICKKKNSNSIPIPNREPFGPEERERLSKAYNTKAEQTAFEEGIIFAEISHGIRE
jgi:isopenicillin N synthase-like dioxygenase